MNGDPFQSLFFYPEDSGLRTQRITIGAWHFGHLKTGLGWQRAIEILDSHFQYFVCLVDTPNENYYMVVCQTELDCLDREKTLGKKTGYESKPEYFATIERWILNEACVGDADMFVLPDSKVTIYVSERFKKRVTGAGLKGFCFKTEFWEEKPFIS